MAAKAPIKGAKSQTTWRIFPEQLSLVFDDTAKGSAADERCIPDVDLLDPDHPLVDPRVDEPLDESMVVAFMGSETDPDAVCARKEGNLIVVVDGRRKTLHQREANRRLVEAGMEPKRLRVRLVKADDKRAVALMIQGNAGRKPETPIQIARKIQLWLGLDEEHTHDLAAHKFSMSAASIRNRLALLELPKSVQSKVAAGRIGTVDAKNLLKLPTAAEQVEAAKELAKTGPKPRGRTGGKKNGAAKGSDGKAKPSKALLLRLADELRKGTKAHSVLLFALGELSQKEAKAAIPEVADALKGGK